MPNKLWKELYGLGTTQKKEREYRTRSGGTGYKKLETQLAEQGLELCNSYEKWYNIYDKNGMNVRYDVFDSIRDIKEWIKNDMEDFLKNGRRED